MITGTKEKLQITSLGNAVGTAGKIVSAPIIIINSEQELLEQKDKVKDKIILYNYAMNQSFIETRMAYGDAGKFRRVGANWASKYGAKAIIVRSLSTTKDEYPIPEV